MVSAEELLSGVKNGTGKQKKPSWAKVGQGRLWLPWSGIA